MSITWQERTQVWPSTTPRTKGTEKGRIRRSPLEITSPTQSARTNLNRTYRTPSREWRRRIRSSCPTSSTNTGLQGPPWCLRLRQFALRQLHTTPLALIIRNTTRKHLVRNRRQLRRKWRNLIGRRWSPRLTRAMKHVSFRTLPRDPLVRRLATTFSSLRKSSTATLPRRTLTRRRILQTTPRILCVRNLEGQNLHGKNATRQSRARWSRS